jgi:hypothetical protein
MEFNWKSIVGIAAGASLALLMVFANQLGLDNNSVWGTKRIIVFFAGLFILAAALLYREDNFIGRILDTHEGQLNLGAAVLVAALIVYYLWCVTFGTWTTWFRETNYYDLQATAFRHGQTAVNVQPDPRFLEMNENELYEPDNRKGIPVLWDATLYKGKYYLYWGPVPAVFLALIKLVYTKEVVDSVLTFVFLSGTLIFLTLAILELRKRYYPATPRWSVLLSIALAGLVNPMTYILFEPRVYEAAIIAAQFFLIGGTYFLITAFDRPSAPRLALAGSFLACTAGSRTTLIPSIGFLALVASIWVIKSQRANAPKFIIAIATPLLIGALGYAGYNYARFDSFMEFGLRYQLTSYNLYKDLDKTFSFAYIPPNLYKNLFNPFELRETFPYIFPTRWYGPAWLENGYPAFYLLLAESITGIFVGSPFMIFAFLVPMRRANENLRWTLAALAGSALLSFFMLEIFFMTTMRYLLDLIPTLAVLAALGFWQGLDLLKSRPIARSIYAIFGLLLFAYGLILSFSLAVSTHFEQIKSINPGLLVELTGMFNGLFK